MAVTDLSVAIAACTSQIPRSPSGELYFTKLSAAVFARFFDSSLFSTLIGLSRENVSTTPSPSSAANAAPLGLKQTPQYGLNLSSPNLSLTGLNFCVSSTVKSEIFRTVSPTSDEVTSFDPSFDTAKEYTLRRREAEREAAA